MGSFSEWLAAWLDRFDEVLGQVPPEQYPALASALQETGKMILGDLPEGASPLTGEEPGVTGWEGTTEDGRRAGVWRHHHRGGPVDEEVTWIQGRRHGPARRWHVEEGFPESADPDAEPCFEQGPLKEAGAFAEDAAEGPWSFWTLEGALASRGHYRRGLPQGTWEVLPGPGSVPSTSSSRAASACSARARPSPSGTDRVSRATSSTPRARATWSSPASPSRTSAPTPGAR
jgi:hypothetical protein